MLAFNAEGMDAVAMGGSNSAALSCSLSASSSTTLTLSTAIKFASALLSSAVFVSSLSNSPANLSATLSSAALVTANVTTLTAAAKFQSAIAAQSTASGDLTTAQLIPAFTPSAARTIYVQSASPVFTGGKWWTLTDPKKPRGLKDPDAVIDITFDWSNWLGDIGSAAISDISFTLNGLNSIGTFYDDTKATVFISGGVVGVASTIACKIKTNTTPSRTDERTVYIDILDE